MTDAELLAWAKLIDVDLAQPNEDLAKAVTEMARLVVRVLEPDGPSVLGTVDAFGTLHCGHCGSPDHIRYEENVVEWRDASRNQDNEINVAYDSGNRTDGDSTPGLICSTYIGGCGHPVDLPDGFELTYS